MEPNFAFENETCGLYAAKNLEFREKAKKLLNVNKVITQKEYDVIMWISCNLSASSVLKKSISLVIKELEIKERLKELNGNQAKLKL